MQPGANVFGIHAGGFLKILCGGLVPLIDGGQHTQTVQRSGILFARFQKTLPCIIQPPGMKLGDAFLKPVRELVVAHLNPELV